MINPTILIVEDNDDVRRLLHEWLEGAFHGYQVIEAATGEQAITIAQARAPRVVIMDISLPGMSGIEATRHIRATMPATQVVILTIHEEKVFRDAAAAVGASAFVPKRMMRTELLPTLAAVLAAQGEAET